ncbi:MAG: FkbM family methyltransferase [Candidatus Lokiarchaeota archaeon]|nr:FkbM family methyltransferase [Candidatus Lokiarchaeota archaeon]
MTSFTNIINIIKFALKFVLITFGMKRSFRITTKEGVVYCGDSVNSTLCKTLYLNKRYEPSIIWYLKTKLMKGDIFIDVGANEGVFSILAGKIVGSEGKVYAIEPLPRNISMLKTNISENNLNNIIVCEVAAGDVKKDVVFHDIKYANMLGGSYNRVISWLSLIPGIVKTIKVTQVRLDELIQVPLNKIKVIKIDAERYESQVLKGISSWLNKNCSIDFIIELKPNSSKEIIDLFINEYGYEAYMHRVDSVAFNDKVRWEKLRKKCKIQKNVLFTKSSN